MQNCVLELNLSLNFIRPHKNVQLFMEQLFFPRKLYKGNIFTKLGFVRFFAFPIGKAGIVLRIVKILPESGKLAGMVVAIKDNICYKNHKVSSSSSTSDFSLRWENIKSKQDLFIN